MRAEEAAGEELVDAIERKGVRAHESRDVRAESRRVAQPPHRRGRELGAALCMVAVGRRLPEIVEERAETHCQGCVGIGRSLDDGEDVLVEGEVLTVAALFEA